MRDPAGGAGREVIHSPANPIIKHVRSLQRRRERQRERAFVVEGGRAVRDALTAGFRPDLMVVREGPLGPAASEMLAAAAHVKIRTVAADLFDQLSDTVTPQGVLAVFPFPEIPLPEVRSPLYLIVDRIRDPGNLGTLLRAAAGAGVTAAFLTTESVDPYNPKAVRAAMGAHFRLPIRPLTGEAAALVEVACPLRVVAEAAATVPYDALDWTQPAALIVGSEAAGTSAEGTALGTISAGIPLAGGVESLNAGVAGAVILFEARRQRRRGPRRGARPPRPERTGDDLRPIGDRLSAKTERGGAPETGHVRGGGG